MADPAISYEGEQPRVTETPVGSAGHRASGWFGMLTLITTEAALFLYLLFSYYYTLVWDGAQLLPAEPPSFRLSLPNTVLLVASSFVLWWGERGARRGDRRQLAIGCGLTILMGLAFAAIQYVEWMEKPFRWDTSTYGSLFFTITGFHMAHVVIGVLMLLAIFVWNLLGYFDRERHAPVAIAAIYWHFVDVVWLAVFFTFYITPYLG